MRIAVAAILLLAWAQSAWAQSERVVDIPSRGEAIRALLLQPAQPTGSVILLAGGAGRLDIGSDGSVAALRGNQLVRTRAAYAAAGLATLVPDVAPGHKTSDGVARGYRWSAEHGRDLAALVAFMRTIRPPVVVVGTSRGAVSAGALLREADGAGRPDGMVLTAPMLMPTAERQPSFHDAIGGTPDRARLPLLVVGHVRDACRVTTPASIVTFRAWHGGPVDVVMLDGPDGTGDPCEARSAHGFAGIDSDVVATVTRWIARLPPR